MADIMSEERHNRLAACKTDKAAEYHALAADLGYSDAEAGKPFEPPMWMDNDAEASYRDGYNEARSGQENPVDMVLSPDDWENSPYYGGTV